MKAIYFYKYNITNAAEKTVHGFEYGDYVWVWEPTKEEIFERLRVSRASTKKGGHAKLMMNDLRKEQKQALIASGRAKMVCTMEYFRGQMEKYGLNKGCAFEQIISLINGGDLYKKGDRRGYWECGDLEINGIQVQVKFGACTLSEFRTIDKAMEICGM